MGALILTSMARRSTICGPSFRDARERDLNAVDFPVIRKLLFDQRAARRFGRVHLLPQQRRAGIDVEDRPDSNPFPRAQAHDRTCPVASLTSGSTRGVSRTIFRREQQRDRIAAQAGARFADEFRRLADAPRGSFIQAWAPS